MLYTRVVMGNVSALQLAPDPGPLARLRDVTVDPNAMAVVVSRIAGGETLKAIADAWGVPYGLLFRWVMADPGRARELSEAEHAAGRAFSHETVGIADGAEESSAAVAKAALQVSARFKLAEHLTKEAPDPRDALRPEQLLDSLVATISANPWLQRQLMERLAPKAVGE